MSFFSEALEILVSKYGDELDLLTVVLPDQNALPAFEKAVSAYAKNRGVGMLMPRLTTLHAFCLDLADVRIPRRLTLLVELHEALKEVDGPLFSRTFEKAKPLLEMMLADFDEMDSQLVDANLLFKSLVEESEITLRFSDFMTEEEVEIIQAYWRHFSTQRMEQHDRLQMELYKKLPAVYATFSQRLAKKGRSYRGAMYREAFGKLEDGSLGVPAGKVAFLGFNKLTESQLAIIEWHIQNDAGILIWDALRPEAHTEESTYYQRRYGKRRGLRSDSVYYMRDRPESGQNHIVLSGAGSLLGVEAFAREVASQLQKRPNTSIALISADGGHARLLAELVADQGIVVRDLHRKSLAATPLFHLLSEIYGLHGRLTGRDTQGHIPYSWLTGIVKHPIILRLYKEAVVAFEEKTLEGNAVLVDREHLFRLEVFKNIFITGLGPAAYWQGVLRGLLGQAKFAGPEWVQPLQSVVFAVNALEDQMGDVFVKDDWTFWSMLSGELATTYMPQEEADGFVTLATLSDIQGQDFDHIYFLDATEGTLPASLPRNSLMPLPIRRAFGMTTPTDDAAQQAYLFFRLLKRAKGAYYFVNQSSIDIAHAEPSRYLNQLRDIGGAAISGNSLALHAQAHPAQAIQIEKTPAIMRKLEVYRYRSAYEQGVKSLYPTQLATYIKCPLLFYLSTLTGLREQDTISEEMDGSRFGNILHNSMEALYKPLCQNGTVVTAKDLDGMKGLSDATVLAKLMGEYGFSRGEHVADLGYVSVSEEVIADIVHKLIDRDLPRTPFALVKVESELAAPYAFTIQVEGKPMAISLNGKFDRADRLADGCIEVVDYKTGGAIEQKVPDWESLFTNSSRGDFKEAFQILMYAWLLYKAEGEQAVRPTIVRIADLFEPDAAEDKSGFTVGGEPVDAIDAFTEEIEPRLRALLEEIFDPAKPFHQTTDEKACRYCSFAGLCHRD